MPRSPYYCLTLRESWLSSSHSVMSQTRRGFGNKKAWFVLNQADHAVGYFWDVWDMEMFSAGYQVIKNMFIYAL